MIINQDFRNSVWLEKHRFKLLLAATLIVLILPAFAGGGILGEILFVACMSFLFIQSMNVAIKRKSKRPYLKYLIVGIMIALFMLEPIGYKSIPFDSVRLMILAAFFVFVTFSLIQFLRKSAQVNVNVIITAINIYLLIGIISGSLAFLFWKLLPDAYKLPEYIIEPTFVNFNYYSFVTMTTLGYGDITPRLPQTQTLAYMIAITGQLYVAIIIAFLVGKLLMKNNNEKIST